MIENDDDEDSNAGVQSVMGRKGEDRKEFAEGEVGVVESALSLKESGGYVNSAGVGNKDREVVSVWFELSDA